MFSHGFPRLETPPPGSHSNRPWSPDRDDPIPPRGLFLTDSRNPVEHRAPSDASIEALDLADYARVLARTDNPHHDLSQDPPSLPAFRAYDNYPPSPPPIRPLASGDSLPSLIGPSISSSRSHNSSVRTPTPLRRPYSLPPPSSFPNHSAPVLPSHSNRTNTREGQGHRPDFPDSPTEIDIGNFPAFSRNWYGQRKPEYDPYPSFSNDRHKLGFFDPAFPSTDIRGFSGYSPPPAYPNFSAYGSRGSREADVLPWSAGHLASDPPLDAEVKQERVRMLEREFGKGKTPAFGEDVRPIGSVDSRGRLITQGPKKRLATRLIQVLLALLAGVSSIYAAAVIKNLTPPPPSGKPPAYVLYVLSVITFLFASYFFLIFPACCGRRKPKDSPFSQGPSGMMVLPVQGLPGGKKSKKSKKKGAGGPGDVQVNLIVDPTLFGGRDRDEENDEEDEYGSGSDMPGLYTSLSSPSGKRRGKHRRGAKRRGIFEGLAIEAQWKRARKFLKWCMAADVVCLVLWGAEFVFIMMGKRCIPGAFNGWCDAYNLATAAACLLCFAFGFSIFFDVKDLHTSRLSPRTRT